MARGKGESSVYQRTNDGLWYVTIELPKGLDGKRRRKTIARKSKRDAMAELKKHRELLGIHGDLATSSMTVDQWATYWIDNVAAPNLAPNTTAGYRTALDQWVRPILGKTRLDRLTPTHVRAMNITIQTTPKDKRLRGVDEDQLPEGTIMLSSTYARLIHTTLSVCLKTAVQDGKIAANPADLVTKPPKSSKAMQALEADEAVGVLRYVSNKPLGALWAAYLLTGARRGEILGLTIDRMGDYLDLSWQIQHHKDLKTMPADWEHERVEGTNLYLCRPKSKAGWRRPPLVSPLKEILQRHIGKRKTGYVFQDEDGNPLNPLEVTKMWRQVLAEAGVTEPVPLHGLRHTAVDLLYELGVAEHVISEIVGHSTRAVTRGYRTRGDMKRQTDALTALGKLLAIDPTED